MIALAWCHLITYTTSIAISAIYLLFESNTNTVAFELLAACDDIILFYPILLSIVLLIKYHYRNRRIGALVSAIPTHNQTQMSAHFEVLEATWDAHLNQVLASKDKKLTEDRQYWSRMKLNISSAMYNNFTITVKAT